MNTKGSGPNDFRHSDDLSELIEGMKNDALEQAKKETEKRRRKAKREYKKDTLQKGNLGKQIKINKDFDKLLKQEKRQRLKNGKKEIKSTAEQFHRRRKQTETNVRKAAREAKECGSEIAKEEKRRRKEVLDWKTEAQKWKKESQRLRRNEKAREKRRQERERRESGWKGSEENRKSGRSSRISSVKSGGNGEISTSHRDFARGPLGEGRETIPFLRTYR